MVLAACITVAGNNTDAPPVLNYLDSDKTSPQDAGTIITWTANASDPDGDPVLYRFFLNDKPMMDWATDNRWIWATNDVDARSNRIEVQVRDGKHAGPSGLDDVRSAGFTLNTHSTTVEPGVFEQVTLTLYIKNGDKSGPSIPGAQVTGQDGSNNSFQQTTDSNGVVTIKGDPGTWSFTTSAEGYETNSWSQSITNTCAAQGFLKQLHPQTSIASKASGTRIQRINCDDEADECSDLILFSRWDDALSCYKGKLECYNQAISQDPNNSHIWSLKGNALDFIASNGGDYTSNQRLALYEDAIRVE